MLAHVPSWEQLDRRIAACRRCPRLREHCAHMATVKRRAFAEQTYWGKPITGFGDRDGGIWIIGLAPAAHGANRTGRIFTGDRSGDFLYAAMHRVGLANQSTATHRDDGLTLTNVYISAAARCAPPGNHPTKEELRNCAAFLDAEWALLRNKRVILALGGIAWKASLDLLARHRAFCAAAPPFAHGAQLQLSNITLLGSYHVSQQNTFTGRLTAQMFVKVLARAKAIAGAD